MRMKRCLLALAALVAWAPTYAQTYPAPIRALVKRGITIKGELPAPPGFKGYIGEFSGQLTPVYLLPDGRHVTIGVLYDQYGRDLTNAAFRAATTPNLDPALWKQLAAATWFSEGPAKPERIVYIFTDTDCPYCHQLWLAVRPYLRQNKVQIRDIIVAVIAPTSLGRGAAVLAAADPAATMRLHEQAFGHSPIRPLTAVAPGIRAKIAANEALMNRVGGFATPVIVYRDEHGRIHMVLGVPDPAAMRAIFGSR